MTRCLLLLSLLLSTTTIEAQRPRLFRATVTLDSGIQADGLLYGLTDSTLLYVANTREGMAKLRTGHPEVQILTADRIERLTIRRKGHLGRSALIGIGLGAIGGLSIAVFTRPQVPVDGWNFMTGLNNQVRRAAIFIVPFGGATYGALAGLIPRRTLRVGHQPDRWRQLWPSVEKFSYQYQEKQIRGTLDSVAVLK